jgi:hypothetical protein
MHVQRNVCLIEQQFFVPELTLHDRYLFGREVHPVVFMVYNGISRIVRGRSQHGLRQLLGIVYFRPVGQVRPCHQGVISIGQIQVHTLVCL